jgi:hypothetical protein
MAQLNKAMVLTVLLIWRLRAARFMKRVMRAGRPARNPNRHGDPKKI